ncbi:MAG: hypothetical protein QM702_02940 [Rubrivivax sp.]
MSKLRHPVAFLAGMAVYELAVVVVGGIGAARQVSPAFFAWFGRPHLEWALALVQLAYFAVPVGLCVAAGTLEVRRWLAGDRPSVMAAMFVGLLLAWVATSLGGPAEFSLGAQLRAVLLPPWWAASAVLAPWLGFGLVVWFTRRQAQA